MREAGQAPTVVFDAVAQLLGLPTEAGESLGALEGALKNLTSTGQGGYLNTPFR